MDTGLLLKKHHLRKTEFRKVVLDIFLSKRGQALSNADIELGLDESDRITLYRTLKSFVEKGLIHHAVDGSGITKYALCDEQCSQHIHHDEHAHFHCQKCGMTICLEHSLQDLQYETPKGFRVDTTQVILKGRCPQCAR